MKKKLYFNGDEFEYEAVELPMRYLDGSPVGPEYKRELELISSAAKALDYFTEAELEAYSQREVKNGS